VGGEGGNGTVPEGDRGDGLLIVEGLGVGEPGVVVERRMQVRVSGLAGAGTGAFGSAGGLGADAVHPPAAAGRDTSEFLDVDVDQVAEPVVLVADDLPQLLAGRWIEVPEPVESSPHQDAVGGRRRECDAVQPL
jgi:hypothetical protein